MSSSQFHFSQMAVLFGIEHHTVLAMRLMYLTIVILSVVVYKLGFAKKLPILKSAVIYTFLLIGCIPLDLLALQLPVIESLAIAAAVLIIYKIRLGMSKRNDKVNKEA